MNQSLLVRIGFENYTRLIRLINWDSLTWWSDTQIKVSMKLFQSLKVALLLISSANRLVTLMIARYSFVVLLRWTIHFLKYLVQRRESWLFELYIYIIDISLPRSFSSRIMYWFWKSKYINFSFFEINRWQSILSLRT